MKDQLAYLRKRGSIYLLVAAVSRGLEVILDEPIPNRFRLSFDQLKMDDAIGRWKPVIEAVLPFVAQLDAGVAGALKSNTEIESSIKSFSQMLRTARRFNEETFLKFRQSLEF